MNGGDYVNGYWVDGVFHPWPPGGSCWNPSVTVYSTSVQLGWQCPACKMVWSPSISFCSCQHPAENTSADAGGE